MATQLTKPKLVRTLRNGQITIPIDIRRELGIDDDTVLRATIVDGKVQLEPVRELNPNEWFKQLYEAFAPVRAEAIEKGYTEDEINGWIDEAIADVRREQRA